MINMKSIICPNMYKMWIFKLVRKILLQRLKFFFFICMCVMHACRHAPICTGMWAHVSVWMCKPETDVITSPWLFLSLILGGLVSQLNPQLADRTCPTSQIAEGSLYLPSDAGIRGDSPFLPHSYVGARDLTLVLILGWQILYH